MKLLSFFAIFISATTALADEKLHQQVTLKGKWLVETNNEVMLHPQTSALKWWKGKLLTLSDRSAHISQQKQLHIIDPLSAIVAKESLVMQLSKKVKTSCFYQYLADKPDFEALAVHPDNENVLIIVTEDARKGIQLSADCQQRFQNTGSTIYPSLLVRLEIDEHNTLSMTHVRPIQFDAKFNVGDVANDGIEALAFGKNNTLFLGLEKDIKGQARIFSTQLVKDFWQSEEFIQVIDTEVVLPTFKKGRHPINGMDYLPVDNHPGYIAAVARNDDQLWIIDLDKQKPTTIISMSFLAPVNSNDKHCNKWEKIGNTSLEGVAVTKEEIWLINDPWTEHYIENVKCEVNREKYQKFGPLLFSLPISQKWF